MTQTAGALSAPMIDHAMKPRKRTERVCLLERLKEAGPLAVHELNIPGHSENALATELPRMAREGLVLGRYRPTKRFKEWSLTPLGEQVA